ncbi:hypothetical protein [Roseibium sp. MMSF_3412]|uniref:hypothetical protein n=1 Tax=Roseibium sp. MMSF_3412 TaxID=3046712 RepID=UPI00273F3826|nr:hypothetical protein [Roseibium sp. MMSF_3412]
MNSKRRSYDSVDIMARAAQSQQDFFGSFFGFGKNKGKWHDRKGPNPLTMQGLDRS